jgi:hypothetical protein
MGIACVCWVAVAALISHIIYLNLPAASLGQVTWLDIFRWALPAACFWGVMTPAVLALARRVRWDRVAPVRFLAVHVTAALALHFAAALLEWSLRPLLRSSAAGGSLAGALGDGLVFDLVRYLMLVAGTHAVDFRTLYERQRSEALELRAELLEAQLAMLRLQLQPHFLFNALHAISELVYRDARLADRAITRLADLLRGSLASEVGHEVALDAELELLDAYLDIERLRAGDALTISFDIEPAARPLAVPNLLLQPLVENALRHGIRGRSRGHVLVGARRRGESLEMRIEDDGAGLAGPVRDGLGLRATRARLRGLYGEEQSLRVEPRIGGGAVTRVEIPARLSVPAVAPDAAAARAAG